MREPQRPVRRTPRFRCSVAIALTLCTLWLACRDVPPRGPLPGVDVRHYDAALRFTPDDARLDARVTLDVTYPDSLDVLPLDLVAMTVDSVQVDGRSVAVHRDGDRLEVPLPGGTSASRIRVVYHGRPERGLRSGRHAGQTVWFTDSWPDAGAGWLPGIHHPADPATWTLTLTVPDGHETVATGTPLGIDTLADGVRSRWRLDVPVPTYALAFAVGDFTVTYATAADTLPVAYAMLAEDAARAGQLRRTPEALAFLADLLGPYAFDRYTSVEVPLGYGGMENATLSFLDARLFAARAAEEVAVHEVVHHWFGNRVPIAGWGDLWLSEGMATYLTALFYERTDSQQAGRRHWVRMARLPPTWRRTHTALATSTRTPTLSWVPYDKGGSVLYLLRQRLGEEAFHAALRRIYAEYAGIPLSTDAFQATLEAETGTDLAAFFAYWVHGDRLPTLETDWDAVTRTLAWRLGGHEGTLDGVTFDLLIRQGSRTRTADVHAGRVVLDGWGTTRPDASPVGVMMVVR